MFTQFIDTDSVLKSMSDFPKFLLLITTWGIIPIFVGEKPNLREINWFFIIQNHTINILQSQG